MNDAYIIIADYAQVQNGKLHVIGGGISLIGPGRFNIGIGVIGRLPWADRSKRQRLKVSLCDASGAIVSMPSPIGTSPFEVIADFEAVPAPGSPQGSEVSYTFAFNAMLDLPPGPYTWKLDLNESGTPVATAPFAVRSGPGAPPG